MDDMQPMDAFILGLKKGQGNIEVDGTNMTFADDGEGNITMTVTEG